jgi:hypothetical protein
VFKDKLFGTGMSNALDHRSVIQGVGENHAVWELAAQRCERGIVGYIARCKHQCCLRSMQFCKCGLQANGVLIVARDIPGSSCAGSVFIKSFMHSLQNLGVSAHAEIVVGTPDGDFLVLVVLVSAGKLLGKAVDVVEVAVGFVLVLLVQLGLVESLVIELGSFVLGRTDRLDLLRIRDYSC